MSDEKKKQADMAMPCPRCHEPKMLIEKQEGAVPSYYRCVACGKVGLVRDLLPSLGRIAKKLEQPS